MGRRLAQNVISYPLSNGKNEFNRLILVVHGAGLNAGKSFETGKKIAEKLKDIRSQILVIAPQFLEGKDLFTWLKGHTAQLEP